MGDLLGQSGKMFCFSWMEQIKKLDRDLYFALKFCQKIYYSSKKKFLKHTLWLLWWIIEELIKMPPLESLLAETVAILNSPAQKTSQLLGSNQQALSTNLSQYIKDQS